MWSHPDMCEVFKKIYDAIGERDNADICGVFPDVNQLLRDDASMRIVARELYSSAYRSAIKDLMGITKQYCNETNQLEKIKAQPWYWAWCILRNYFAHDLIFNFNKTEKQHLPISWNGIKIDISMNGHSLTHAHCSYPQIIELIKTAENFIVSDLS
jgi:hypothetical protein